MSTCEHEWERVEGDWCRRCGTLQHRNLIMPAAPSADQRAAQEADPGPETDVRNVGKHTQIRGAVHPDADSETVPEKGSREDRGAGAGNVVAGPPAAAHPTDVAKMVKRLCAWAPAREWHMQKWDEWRKYIKEGGGASWPRDAFESLLDAIIEDATEAAALLARSQNVGWVPMGWKLVPRKMTGKMLTAFYHSDLFVGEITDSAIQVAWQETYDEAPLLPPAPKEPK